MDNKKSKGFLSFMCLENAASCFTFLGKKRNNNEDDDDDG